MQALYGEIPPPAQLALYVECFWTHSAREGLPHHRVLPDGCVDIVFSRCGTGPGELKVVGTMTRPQVFSLPAGQFHFGVRFRPAMYRGFLPVPGRLLTDRSLPLNAVWGTAAERLREQLAEAPSVRECVALFEALLNRRPPQSPVQRAVLWLAETRGCARIDDLADQAGLSARQFRRLCLEQTGLTPKRLARVLRFRHAWTQARNHAARDWAGFAVDCGYYDQAHLIHEFREFSGSSPAECASAAGRVTVFSNPPGAQSI